MATELEKIEKAITKLRDMIISNNEEMDELQEQPYREVKEKFKKLEAKQDANNVKLDILLNQKTNMKKYDVQILNLNDKPVEVVQCIAEISADIRFGATIETRVMFDLSNNKNFSNEESPAEILKLSGVNDHETATDYKEIECIKIGNKYYTEVA